MNTATRKYKMESHDSVILPLGDEENDPILLDTVKEIVEKAENADVEGEYFLISDVQEDAQERAMQVTTEENVTPSISQMCRICATAYDHLIPLFEGEGLEHDLCSKIHKHLPIKLTKDDTLPLQLCYHCAATLLAWNDLSEGCLVAQSQLLRLQEQAEQRKSLAYQEEEKVDQVEENTTSDAKFHQRELPQEEQRKSDYLKSDQTKNVGVPVSERFDNKFIIIQVKDLENNENEEGNQLLMNGKSIETTLPSQSKKRQKSKSSSGQSFCDQLTKDRRLELTQSKIVIDRITHYRCRFCSKILSSISSYLIHRNRHLGDRPYACHKCAKGFSTASGRNRHVRDVHIGLKKYACDICGRPFASRITRDEHRLTHTGERPYICEICGKAFTQKASLHVHKQFHTEDLSHWCTMCKRGFKRKQELNKHILIHTGQKPYACDVCGKCFRSQGCISRHKRTHNQQKSHICNLCGAAFGQERYLKNHRQNKHKDV